MQIFGRLPTLVGGELSAGIFALCQLFGTNTNNISLTSTMRFFAGIGLGVCVTVVPLYLAEASPKGKGFCGCKVFVWAGLTL